MALKTKNGRRFADVPKILRQQTDLEQLSYDDKYSSSRKILEKLVCKFSRRMDKSLFKELDRIVVNLEDIFVNQRRTHHLAKLAYSIYFARKKLARERTLFPFRDFLDIRIFPSFLYFTFGFKPVLSILIHAHLKNKYEIFDEEQVLFIISKLMPDVLLVKDSVYAFQSSKNTVKTLYFEIYKKSGSSFSPEEIKQLKDLLKQEVKFSIEQLAPRVFMVRNEEEVLKNILTLSREIHFVSDLPQVMILFDQQTSQEAIFTIILVKILKKGQLSIKECFARTLPNIEFIPERCQVVRYLRKKYPLEANVFGIKLIKDSSLLRTDLSLNFYLARQKISRILEDAIGEFRDYNGGIIIKQREALASFRTAFQELSVKESDLLENFYYSLTPIEAQATILLEDLKILFELFLEARNSDFTKPSDFFLKFKKDEDQFFVVIRIPDSNFKENIDSIFSSFKLDQTMISFNISAQNTCFLGYFLAYADRQMQQELCRSIQNSLKNWKERIEKRQIFKIGLAFPVVSLDPRIGGDQVSALILKMLFEGLMRINREGKLEKGIAQHVTISSDQRTYLFRLHSTLWSNGAAVTAYDFEYAWKKVLSPTFETPFAYFFYPIKNAKLAKKGLVAADAIGVQAIDPLTLKVELEFPAPYFLELTAHTIYSPINCLIDQKHPNWPFEDREGYVGNGAFKIRKNDLNEGYELIKNPLYWDASNIKLDEIRVLKTDLHHTYEMFRKGQSHWIGAPLGIWDPSFIPGKNDDRIMYLESGVYWFVFNTQRFPFNHKKILNLPLAITPIPSIHSQMHHSVLSTCHLDEARALFKEALKELNMSLQDFPEIPLIYLKGPTRNKVAHFIKEEWEYVFGIRCILDPLEWKVLFPKMTGGNFQIGGISWESWIDDPIYTLNAFRDIQEPINFPKWENKKYQETMHFAEREIDLQIRKSLYLQAEKILLEEMPVMPIFTIEAPALKKKNFHIRSSSSLMDFKWGYFS